MIVDHIINPLPNLIFRFSWARNRKVVLLYYPPYYTESMNIHQPFTTTAEVLLGRDLRRSPANSASLQAPSLLRRGRRGALRAARLGGSRCFFTGGAGDGPGVPKEWLGKLLENC